MKAVAVLAVAAMLLLPTTADTLPPGPFRISLQTRLLSTRGLGASSQSRTYALYNRPAYKKRIGTAVMLCTAVDVDWRSCREFLRLSRGTIVAEALVPAASSFYNLAVVGGTGIYSNTGGTITLQPITGASQILVSTIEAFS